MRSDAREKLVEYHWPGNVRELRNILERAAILCDGGLVTADHLALTVPRPAAVSVQLAAAPLPRPASSSTGSDWANHAGGRAPDDADRGRRSEIHGADAD
jgi:transcriptional regulator of acetoin/glycerol metabolism